MDVECWSEHSHRTGDGINASLSSGNSIQTVVVFGLKTR